MLDANIATTILPVALVKISSKASMTSSSEPREPAAIDVGAVGQQRQHAGGAELREAVEVDVLAVERRLIDLEVAGVDHHAARRLDRQRHAVGHAVRDAQELDRERADRDALARLDRAPAGRLTSLARAPRASVSTSASVSAVP